MVLMKTQPPFVAGIQYATSGTRPATPILGEVIMETDTKMIQRYGGSGVGWEQYGGGGHGLVSSTHTVSGLTTGHVLRATGATTFGFGAIQATDLPNHELISKHTVSGLTTGHVLQATGATTFDFAAIPAHNIVSGHNASGLTTGHVLKATGATAFGFGALTAAEISAAPSEVWTASIKCATWSRIMTFTGAVVAGHNILLNVRGTRSSVVYNATFAISTSHNNKGHIAQLINTSYSNIKIRTVVDTNGNGYIELWDDANGATNATNQSVVCRYINMSGATGITTYTAFTDGTTVPGGHVVSGEITTVFGSGEDRFEARASDTAWSGTKKTDYTCSSDQCIYASTSTTLVVTLGQVTFNTLKVGNYSLVVRLKSSNNTAPADAIKIDLQKNVSGTFTSIATKNIKPTMFTSTTNYQCFYFNFDYTGTKATNNELRLVVSLLQTLGVFEVDLDYVMIMPVVVGAYALS